MSAKWIRKGDKVLVIAGNEKGRTGVVLRRQSSRVVIQGINIRKKHVKRRSQAQVPSIIEMEMPLHISNVHLCDDEGKIFRVKARRSREQSDLVYLKDQKEVVFRSLKKSKR